MKIEKGNRDIILANNSILRAICTTNNSDLQYPDEFSGIHVSNNRLCVTLKKLSPAIVNRYKEMAGTYAGTLIFDEAKYSFNELKAATTDIVKKSVDLGINIKSCFVSQSLNCIVVTAENGSDERQLLSLKDASSPYPVIFRSIPKSLIDPHEGDNIPSRYSATDITIYAGSRITVPSSSAATLSAFGRYNNKSCFVTAGHLTSIVGVGGDILYNGSLIGTVSLSNFDSGGTGDYGFVTLNDGYIGSNLINDVNPIVGGIFSLPEGYTVYFYGNKSNAVQTGTITGNNVYFNGCVGMTEVHAPANSILPGDSGGPVYVTGEGGVDYCGLIAGNIPMSTYAYMYYTPYGILRQAGFAVDIVT